ncbi:hypothetical protein BH09SUM1_BH09SUM1_28700 [soil metagenome]
MPGTMERTATLLKILIVAVMALAAPIRAAEDVAAKLIVTANTERLFPIKTDDPALKDGVERFEKEIMRLKEANPDAILVDAGNHLSMTYSLETAYNYPATKTFDKLEYGLVNLNSREAVLSMVGNVGYRYSPKTSKEKVIANFETQSPNQFSLPPAKTISGVTFVSLAWLKSISGLAGKLTMAKEMDWTKVLSEIATGRKAGNIVVGFSSMPAEIRNSTLSTGETRPDYLFDMTLQTKDPAETNGLWLLPVPAVGEAFVVTLKKSGNKFAEPAIERSRYLSAEESGKLLKFQKPNLGMEIPNIADVAPQYFGTDGGLAQVDTIPAATVSEFTKYENPTAYQLTLDGKKVRIYRCNSTMPNYQYAGYTDMGWPGMDMLIVLNEDHSFNRVLSRFNFPIAAEGTTTLEALNRLAGKDPATWTPDPEFASGAEELWLWGATEIKNAIEMDKKVHPAAKK